MFPIQSYSHSCASETVKPDFEKLISAIIVIAMCLNVSAAIFILVRSPNEKTPLHQVVINSGKKIIV